MESDLTLGHPLDFGSVVKVIDMPVGDQKQVDSYPKLPDPVQ
jgi:hypothetical protein